jgi:hypothetical protein
VLKNILTADERRWTPIKPFQIVFPSSIKEFEKGFIGVHRRPSAVPKMSSTAKE